MKLRPAEHVTEASMHSTVSFMQYNDYKVRNELAPQSEEHEQLNIPLRSDQMQQALDGWDSIQKLGGTTRTIHAVESAQRAFIAAPKDNNKLIVLISDGVTDDWSDSITELLKIQAQDEKAHLLVVGVAACSYYEDEFPTVDTLKLLGKDMEHSLFMLSRDNESTRGQALNTMAPG
eukprot:TRINITY_DN26416_c0_g1_i1.p1 TRINITY_DN26416_c0_g1~~TRINITY_DN26416_c0_g1_i1.p1  ORF type:complete len:176 (+),score=60.72 TRINITY_DN26416_c0_g1_i1:163-690(+)